MQDDPDNPDNAETGLRTEARLSWKWFGLGYIVAFVFGAPLIVQSGDPAEQAGIFVGMAIPAIVIGGIGQALATRRARRPRRR